MQFCLYELSQNQELQEKARQDIEKALKKHGELSYEAIGDMKYLEQCIEGEHNFNAFSKLKLQISFQKVSENGLQFQPCQDTAKRII